MCRVDVVHNPCMLQVCSGYGMSQVNDHVHVLAAVCLSGYLYAYTSLQPSHVCSVDMFVYLFVSLSLQSERTRSQSGMVTTLLCFGMSLKIGTGRWTGMGKTILVYAKLVKQMWARMRYMNRQWIGCMMSMVCLFGNPFPQNFKEVTDQSSLLNTGTLLSASPVKICFIPLHPTC